MHPLCLQVLVVVEAPKTKKSIPLTTSVPCHWKSQSPTESSSSQLQLKILPSAGVLCQVSSILCTGCYYLYVRPKQKGKTLGSISWHEREQRPGEVSWNHLSVSATAGSSNPILRHLYRQSLDAMQMQHTTWGGCGGIHVSVLATGPIKQLDRGL